MPSLRSRVSARYCLRAVPVFRGTRMRMTRRGWVWVVGVGLCGGLVSACAHTVTDHLGGEQVAQAASPPASTPTAPAAASPVAPVLTAPQSAAKKEPEEKPI